MSSPIQADPKMRAVLSSRAAHRWDAKKRRRHNGRKRSKTTGRKFPSVSALSASAQRVRQPFRVDARPLDNFIFAPIVSSRTCGVPLPRLGSPWNISRDSSTMGTHFTLLSSKGTRSKFIARVGLRPLATSRNIASSLPP